MTPSKFIKAQKKREIEFWTKTSDLDEQILHFNYLLYQDGFATRRQLKDGLKRLIKDEVIISQILL